MRETLLLILVLAPAGAARAQTAPQVMGTSENRVLWIFPNYKTVDEANSLARIGAGDKLEIAAKDSFDPYAFPIAGMFAGASQLENQYPSWGRGWRGYEKRALASFADQTISNAMTEAAFPILLSQDPRYFRMGRGPIPERAWYAVTRVFVTRDDDGSAQFNYSEFGGNAAMAAAGLAYYPRQDANAGNVAVRFGSQVIFDMLAGIGKEFWPDLKHWLVGG